MTAPINLTQLRALSDGTLRMTITTDELLALIDTAETAIRKYDEMHDSKRYWPNERALRETLTRYTT